MGPATRGDPIAIGAYCRFLLILSVIAFSRASSAASRAASSVLAFSSASSAASASFSA